MSVGDGRGGYQTSQWLEDREGLVIGRQTEINPLLAEGI